MSEDNLIPPKARPRLGPKHHARRRSVLAGTLDGALVLPARRAFKMIGVSKTKGFAMIKAGILRTVKIGRSTLVTAESMTEVARYGVPLEQLTGKQQEPRRNPLRRPQVVPYAVQETINQPLNLKGASVVSVKNRGETSGKTGNSGFFRPVGFAPRSFATCKRMPQQTSPLAPEGYPR